MTQLSLKQSGYLRLKLDASAQTGNVTGLGSVFGNVDSYGDMVMPGAFAKSLAQHKREGTMPLMLWMHDQTKPIGRWLDMEETDIGLLVRGQFNTQTTAGKDAFHHVTGGDVAGLSIGYRVPDGGAEIDQKTGVQKLRGVELFEVSVVSFPANRQSLIQLGSKSELEDHLRKSGMSKEAARRVAFGGWPALDQSAPSDFSPLLAALQASARRF
ncbi:HK97 family phage prohead protease [Aureimonas flava]|uniref:HK97 family phage prohead protease n=1 Tax=Aureimonas flava TaxID=2320271 RepID=A0A3A1WNP0_9HYPH|nr:HK97 family phage prohead protease [Aureimonas flava]RIY01483.1 HK97 family phage prohead protease [Aureimonas flava]